MKRKALVLAVSTLLACESVQEESGRGDEIVETSAQVEYAEVEGGAWVLRAYEGPFDPGDAGERYVPRNLPEAYQLVGARVDVRLKVLRDLVTTPMVGTPVDILRIEPYGCGATCGAAPPPITVDVTPEGGEGPVPGLAMSNLTGPPPRVGASQLRGDCWSSLRSACEVWGPVPGTFGFDLGAPGYEPLHLEVVVPEVVPLPGACCPLGYEPRQLAVSLAPG